MYSGCSRAGDRSGYNAIGATNRPGLKKNLVISHADVLIPELRVLLDELAHELDALGLMQHFDADALRAHVVLRPFERDVLAYDDPGDAIQQNGATAHRAGAEGRIDRATLINRGLLAAGVSEAIHLRVVDDAPTLHALVAAAPDNVSVEDKDRADGNAALGQPHAGFVQGGAHEFIHR